jgi:hypothetical protein
VQQSGADRLACVRRHDVGPPILVTDEVVAAFDAGSRRSLLWRVLPAGPSRSRAECGSCGNRDALNADELECLFRRARHFETQFDSFANPLGDLVQRSRLGMASRELWD